MISTNCVLAKSLLCVRNPLSELWRVFEASSLVATHRCLHVSCVSRNPFWETHPKGDPKYARKEKPTLDTVAEALQQVGPEFRKWQEEVKDHFRADKDLFPVPDGVVDIFSHFDGPESLKGWLVSCDSDHNEGFSSANLTSTSLGYGLFSGNLSTRTPKDGRITSAGYCNLRAPIPYKSFFRPTPYLLQKYTHLVLRLRGDGRTYVVNMHTPGYGDITWLDVFTYPLYTRGGPYWQISKIPFAKFVQQYKGRVQDNQHPLPRENVSAISIGLYDNNNGPFHLEIDYIGAERKGNPDPYETAYEKYDESIFLLN